VLGQRRQSVARTVERRVGPLQRARVGVKRRAEDPLGRAALDDIAGIEHDDLIAKMGGEAQIVGDKD